MPFAAAYLAEVVFLLSKQALQGEELKYGWLTQWIYGGYGPGSYYYPVIVQFIFLFPIIYFTIRRFRLGGLSVCFIVNGVYEILKSVLGMGEGWYRLLIFRYVFLIGFGCYIYINKMRLQNFVFFSVMAGIGIGFILQVQYMGYEPEILYFWSGTSFIASMYIMPIAEYILTSSRCIRWRCEVLEQLGRASYHVFLVQMIYYGFFSGVFYKIFHNRIAAFIAGSIVCLAGGYLFYRLEHKLAGLKAAWTGNDKK